jgi:hypothetical protein
MPNRLLKTLFITLILVLSSTLIVALPVMALDDTEDSDLLLVSGELTFGENGELIVDVYIIAPAGAFIPAGLQEGDNVLITGYLLPDGVTIQALSLEFFEEEDEEDANGEEVGDVDEPSDNDDADDEMNGEDDEEEIQEEEETPLDEERGFFCRQENGMLHPAGVRLSNEFDVSYNEIMVSFCNDRLGFGQIMIAHLWAEAMDEDVASILELRAQGLGWGQIMKQSDVHPAEVFGARARGRGPWGDDERPGGGPPNRDDHPGRGGGRPDNPGGGRPENPGGGPPAGRGGGRP